MTFHPQSLDDMRFDYLCFWMFLALPQPNMQCGTRKRKLASLRDLGTHINCS